MVGRRDGGADARLEGAVAAMIPIPSGVRVWIATGHTDMRRGMQGLALQVQDQMRRSSGITCRKCHNAAAIHPTSDAGRSAHAALQQGDVTCIDCHANIVHSQARSTP